MAEAALLMWLMFGIPAAVVEARADTFHPIAFTLCLVLGPISFAMVVWLLVTSRG